MLIFLKRRDEETEKWWRQSWRACFYGPWRERPGIVKISRGPSRRWRRVSPAPSAFLTTAEPLAGPLCPALPRPFWPPRHPLTGPARASGTVALADTERRRALVPPVLGPSIPRRAREPGKFTGDTSGP